MYLTDLGRYSVTLSEILIPVKKVVKKSRHNWTRSAMSTSLPSQFLGIHDHISDGVSLRLGGYHIDIRHKVVAPVSHIIGLPN
jgi:hypothetical protein